MTPFCSSMVKLSAEEIRLRGLLLGENKELLKLHRDLVMAGKLKEEEFWETRKGLLESQQVQLQLKKAPTTSSLLGIDIRPQSDIQGDLKFVLTPSLIKSIFEQTPIIQRAYNEKVPGTVDEKTFWMQYFTSKFFKEGLSAGSMSEKASPNGNLFDEYYQESQMETEGSLALQPAGALPISIDIMATTEDHFQVADPDARPAEATREERVKAVTIRKLNKLSSNIVESSGAKRLESGNEVTDEALMAHEQLEKFIPLDLKESLVDAKINVILDEKHIEKLCTEWNEPTASSIIPLSYAEYSRVMQTHRPISAKTENGQFMPSDLSGITEDAYQTWINNMIELLRQFWAAFPPGASKDLQERTDRIAKIINDMLLDLQRWTQASTVTERERSFLTNSLGHLQRAAAFAISRHRSLADAPVAPMAPKRAKTTLAQ